jgi:hypothetical protein
VTSGKRDPASLPHWPRLLSKELAAAYLGISPNALVALGVPQLRVGSRVLYDREALDRWVDALARPVEAPSSLEAALEAYG